MPPGSTSSSSTIGGPVPQPGTSRQGRQQQRYAESGERLVAGCIPVKFVAAGDGPEDVRVLLITSRGGKGWVFPKGGWEDDETVEAAALRETVEEAGVRGDLEEPLLGIFPFSSGKQERLHNVHKGRCIAHMYIMRVAEELDVWPECTDRQRGWFSISDASHRCRHPWMRDALHKWVATKGWSHTMKLACTAAVAAAAAANGAAAVDGPTASAGAP